MKELEQARRAAEFIGEHLNDGWADETIALHAATVALVEAVERQAPALSAREMDALVVARNGHALSGDGTKLLADIIDRLCPPPEPAIAKDALVKGYKGSVEYVGWYGGPNATGQHYVTTARSTNNGTQLNGAWVDRVEPLGSAD